MFWFVVDGRKTPIHTWFSHGRKKADDWLLNHVANEMRLTKQELLAFVECTLSASEYLRLLVERGHIRPK